MTDWLSPNEDHSQFCQLAWSLLNDCYFSKICINVKPDHLAVTVCYMAMETQGISLDLEQHAETVWWKVGLTSILWSSSDIFTCETLLFDNSQKLISEVPRLFLHVHLQHLLDLSNANGKKVIKPGSQLQRKSLDLGVLQQLCNSELQNYSDLNVLQLVTRPS